jgi:hypothetical protein
MRKADWALSLGLAPTDFTSKKGVCSHHFADSEFHGSARKRLKEDAIPSMPSSVPATALAPSAPPAETDSEPGPSTSAQPSASQASGKGSKGSKSSKTSSGAASGRSQQSWAPEGSGYDSDCDESPEPPDELMVIVEMGKLKKLLQFCPYCGTKRTEKFPLRSKISGSNVVMQFGCPAWGCRGGSWSGQSFLEQKGTGRPIAKGNFRMASAIIPSGQTVSRVMTYFHTLGCAYLSRSQLFKIQSTVVVEAVAEVYDHRRGEILAERDENRLPLTLAGDGRFASMGFSSRECTYILQDLDTGFVLHTECLSRAAGDAASATELERAGFNRSLSAMVDRFPGRIDRFVSDAHAGVGCDLKKNPKYQGIFRQLDVWHALKPLVRDLAAAAKEKHGGLIAHWHKSIIACVWGAIERSDGDAELLRQRVLGILKHLRNEHQWAQSTEFPTLQRCEHKPIADPDSIAWLESDSSAYKAVDRLLNNKRFLAKLPLICHGLNTSSIESVNSIIADYAHKMDNFDLATYEARCRCAVMHWNAGVGRDYQTSSDGELQYLFYAPKTAAKTRQVAARPKREPRKHDWRDEMMQKCMSIYLRRREEGLSTASRSLRSREVPLAPTTDPEARRAAVHKSKLREAQSNAASAKAVSADYIKQRIKAMQRRKGVPEDSDVDSEDESSDDDE